MAVIHDVIKCNKDYCYLWQIIEIIFVVLHIEFNVKHIIMKFSKQIVKKVEVNTDSRTGELYFTAKVNNNNYIGSIFMVDNYMAVSFARNINSIKRTTIKIISAIEKSLNKTS